ncbi:MAG: AEC family transporter [Kaiparowitsia implicata GSE-PSE-MK54-09C]|jgi:predicted permease|nr:AEC family transporter [Kaiparowitsia implicata GSE-PSE-MK54-09C]
MADTLLHAYEPLLLWTGLGLILFRFLPASFPRWLGRGLYWVGVPVQIFALARNLQVSEQVELVPYIVVAALASGFVMAAIAVAIARWFTQRSLSAAEDGTENPWSNPAAQGSFILSSMLGNTGFVGLAIAPTLIDPAHLGWVVCYSVTHNVVGTYGFGVLLASHFGRSRQTNPWITLRDIATVPSLWAFGLGFASQRWAAPQWIDESLKLALWMVIPAALLLMGIRLRQLQGWQSLRRALAPASIKILALPLVVSVMARWLGIAASPQLALVLMSGMPTAFAGLILAEEYDLDRDLIASSIVTTTVGLLLTLPLWLWLF